MKVSMWLLGLYEDLRAPIAHARVGGDRCLVSFIVLLTSLGSGSDRTSLHSGQSVARCGPRLTSVGGRPTPEIIARHEVSG
jgi:hypothetical protein